MSRIIKFGEIEIDVEDWRRGFTRYLREKDKKRNKYFMSEEFRKLLGIISEYEFISEERMKYNLSPVKGLTAEKFGKVCDAVFYKLPLVRERNTEFPTYHVVYEGVIFHLMIGQGSTYWTTLKKGRKNNPKNSSNARGHNSGLEEIAQSRKPQ